MQDSTKGQVISIGYDDEHDAMIIQASREAFVPSFLYYLIMNFENQHDIKIKTVIFMLDTSRAYRPEELKGVKRWSDIDLADIERIDEDELK